MRGPEEDLRLAAESAWNAFSDYNVIHQNIHPDCAVVVLSEDGTYVEGLIKKVMWPQNILNQTLAVDSVKASSVGKQSSSSVKVRIGAGEYTGFFVFLKENEAGDLIWRCISVALGPRIKEQIIPKSYEEVNRLTWDGYSHANRICDGELMSTYFHRTCRLTYTGPSDRIVICNSKEFCEKVSGRYEKEELHMAYAHLKNSPLLDDANSLLSIDFSSAQIAMVLLRIGHPPFLWTDSLTCARILENGEMKWWIMHKASDNEPHPLLDSVESGS
jgi:hypothetical protein